MTRARVIGAGLSGLTAACALARRGIDVEIYERASVPGGMIRTDHLPEGPCETGANGFVWSPSVERLFSDLSLSPVFARDASRRRYIYRNKKPRRWPLGAVESSVLAAKLGFALLTRAARPRPGESMARWGTRVLGGPAATWLVSPALQGIYGAAAEDLSAPAIFAGRSGGRVRLAAPRDGMGAVIDALESQLRERGAIIRYGADAPPLDPAIPTIVCTDAAAAAALIGPHYPAFADAARRIRRNPLVTVNAFFEPRPTDLRGFGVLFPRGTARALGVLFNTEIFEYRGLLRSERWIFGDRALVDAPASVIEAAVQQDRALIAAPSPIVNMHVKGWDAALPVYDEAVIEVARAAESMPPWLGVCGNYLGRIGVSALVERAEDEAARICAGQEAAVTARPAAAGRR